MFNTRTTHSVYATDGSIDPSTSQKFFWLNANYSNEVEAHAVALRILEGAERGATEVEVRTTTTITKG